MGRTANETNHHLDFGDRRRRPAAAFNPGTVNFREPEASITVPELTGPQQDASRRRPMVPAKARAHATLRRRLIHDGRGCSSNYRGQTFVAIGPTGLRASAGAFAAFREATPAAGDCHKRLKRPLRATFVIPSVRRRLNPTLLGTGT